MSNPFGMVTGRIRRVQDSARQTRAAVTRPKPPVEVDTGRTVPAWLLRLVCVIVGVAAVIILAPSVVVTVIISGLLLLVAVRPTPATGAIFCAALGFFWVIMPTPPFGAGQFALLAIAHLVWALSGVLSELPLRTKIEWAALRPSLVRFVIIDLISQLLLVGGQLLHGSVTGQATGLTSAIVLGCAVLVAIAAWLILPRLGRV